MRIDEGRVVMPVALILAAAWPPPAAAQDLSFAASSSPQQLLADQFAMVAPEGLGSSGEPTEQEITWTRVLLDLAIELAPNDGELWWMRAELADLMHDEDVRTDALRKYLKIAPEDDAAQYALIQARLDQFETLDERLAKIERMLSAEGARVLSAPLRSRVATYAATAARELGDDKRFAKWLRTAVSLDPANGDAASLTFDLAEERGAPDLIVAVASINRVRAMPDNVGARVDLALRLVRLALYERAAQQFNMCTVMAQQSLPPNLFAQWVFSEAAAGQSDKALTMLSRAEAAIVAFESQAEAAGSEAAVPDPDAPKPAFTLPADIELLRLAILTGSGREPVAVEASMGRMVAAIQEFVQTDSTGDTAEEQDMPGEPIELGKTFADVDPNLTLAWISAVFAQTLDVVELYLAELDADDPAAQRARGWVALRNGQEEAARSLLEPLAEQDPYAAYGLARMEKDGSRVQVSALQEVVQTWPNRLPGLLAAMTLRKTAMEFHPSREGKRLAKLMDQWPSRIWHTDFSLTPWLSMQVRVEPARVQYLEPLHGRVIISNMSGISLPIGSQRTVRSNLMVFLSASVAGQQVGPLPPMFINLARRLTLPAGEKLEVGFRLDRSSLGRMLSLSPRASMNFMVKALFDPKVLDTGQVIAGPLGAVDTVRSLQSWGLPVTVENVDLWLADIDSVDATAQMRAIARLLNATQNIPIHIDAETTRRRIADAIDQRYPKFDRVRQAWTVWFVKPTEVGADPFQRVIDLAQRSDDPMVRVAHLAAHVRDVKSPALTAALRHENPVIHGFGQALKAKIEAAEAAAAAAATQEE